MASANKRIATVLQFGHDNYVVEYVSWRSRGPERLTMFSQSQFICSTAHPAVAQSPLSSAMRIASPSAK